MYISEKQIEIRYAETDQMGVVYHANYVIWLEIGRAQLIKDLGFEYAKLEQDGFLSPVLDVSIQYKAALRYGQVATVRTWIESHSRLRTTYGYEILHEDGTLAATATSVHTLVRKENFRPIALSKVNPKWEAAYIEHMRMKK
ncbi:thioesterase family protein [Metasolibacillus sp. FSL H7-0170]|uniref:acyl-CoA thioesterase n=1 Tax=Metasolibacillus TaxID=2703677 RepID=UPI000D34D0ED|nr:thioesterase family protein [Metasolibacillus fluoroglycofenilyticus]